MAHAATHFYDRGAILRVLAAPFIAIGNGLVALGEANPRVRKAQELHAMTDEQLAEIGLKREDIGMHVFSDCLYS